MTPFIVFICYEERERERERERVYKKGTVAIIDTNGYVFLKFPIDK